MKERGYRVEPGEVERALVRHPGEAVVLPDRHGENRSLVAFYVLHGDDRTSGPGQPRAWCAERLPGFMVPSRLVRLPEIPAGEHGTRDLDALSRLLAEERASRPAPVAAASPTEACLIRLWQELLGVEPICIDDHFFSFRSGRRSSPW